MDASIVAVIGSGVLFCIAFAFFYRRMARALESHFTHAAADALRAAQENFVTLAKERLGTQQENIERELNHKQELIATLVQEIRRDIAQSTERLRQSDEQRIATFAAVKQELDMQRTLSHELRTTTDDLKRVLSNNQLRGAFGEQVADNLLKMAGFVVGQDYVANREQESVETRPDFTIFLPDRTKINIDVKFPYAALVRATSLANRDEQDAAYRQFASDVRTKVKQVSNREYINPEEKTVDFVILFIPNEMIFSFIYDQLTDVWEEAMAKKVIMAGPFSFTALLRMIKQAYTNFRYQENIHHVIGLIHKFETEYIKYSESIDTLGDRLQSTVKQFEAVSGTRHRALTRVFDQIKSQNLASERKEKESILPVQE